MARMKSSLWGLFLVFLALGHQLWLTTDVYSQTFVAQISAKNVEVLHMEGIEWFSDQEERMDFWLASQSNQLLAYQSETILTANELIESFFVVLTLSDDQLWVNLDPHQADRMIPSLLAQTRLGRSMLQQDLMLKQWTTDVLHPDTTTGQHYWQSQQQTDLPKQQSAIKVWVVPQEAEVAVHNNQAWITKKKLTLLSEGEYQSDLKSATSLLLDQLTQAVHQEDDFAPLRQTYSLMILAQWYKRQSMNRKLNQGFINHSVIQGLTDVGHDQYISQLRQRYLTLFRDSDHWLRETYQPLNQTISTKHYVTGGLQWQGLINRIDVNSNSELLPQTRVQAYTTIIQELATYSGYDMFAKIQPIVIYVFLGFMILIVFFLSSIKMMIAFGVIVWHISENADKVLEQDNILVELRKSHSLQKNVKSKKPQVIKISRNSLHNVRDKFKEIFGPNVSYIFKGRDGNPYFFEISQNTDITGNTTNSETRRIWIEAEANLVMNKVISQMIQDFESLKVSTLLPFLYKMFFFPAHAYIAIQQSKQPEIWQDAFQPDVIVQIVESYKQEQIDEIDKVGGIDWRSSLWGQWPMDSDWEMITAPQSSLMNKWQGIQLQTFRIQ